MIKFKEFTNSKGEIILYTGNPDLVLLEDLSNGVGDVWHSSLDQGFRGVFEEIICQSATFFWYNFELEDVNITPSWRINPFSFAVRKNIWEQSSGFVPYKNIIMSALDFGFNALRYQGIVVLYVNNLYDKQKLEFKLTSSDRYEFFFKNFSREHAFYMLYRKGLFSFKEWKGCLKNIFLKKVTRNFKYSTKQLNTSISNNATVDIIIPTLERQKLCVQLLEDIKNQTYLPQKVIIIDTTPVNKRDEKIYEQQQYPFNLIVKYRDTKGSCKSRNQAIEISKSDYIIFCDDDIRIPSSFVENHLKYLQTFNIEACNGLDIRANSLDEDLNDLSQKLISLNDKRYISGITSIYSNANSCVSRKVIELLEGNDLNFEGGYGEDIDFGISIHKKGFLVLQNPYATSLHLKPPRGGYRIWEKEAKNKGNERKRQPWELDTPVTSIIPNPSPTMMYYFLKNFTKKEFEEYEKKYFFKYIIEKPLYKLPYRLFMYKNRKKQFNLSKFYANKLLKLGKQIK